MSSSSVLRTTARTVFFTGLGACAVYQGHHYYQTSHFYYTRKVAHAEAPSDAQAGIQKTLPWKGFTELQLESAEMVNHNVRRLVFALPTDDTVSGLAPVTSLLTRHTPDGAWLPVFRPYTPITHGDTPGRIEFLVKRYPDGKGSGKMHALTPGDTMKFKPLHEFDYRPNTYDSILLIAGGSGITPCWQLATAVLADPADRTAVTLIYANNTPDDILLRSEIEALEHAHPDRFRKLFTVTNNTDKTNSKSPVETGHVTREMIAQVWPAKRPGQLVLVSGPPAMTDAVAGKKGGFGWTQGPIGGILAELGYEKGEVHKF